MNEQPRQNSNKLRVLTEAVVQSVRAITRVVATPLNNVTTKLHIHPVKAARITHHHIAKRPHEHLMQHVSWYSRWHNWKWHKLVHFSVLALYITLVGLVVFNAYNTPSYALSSWAQTNWSGGVGTDTTNQYASKSNLDATSSSLSVTGTNAITNGGFETNLNGWAMTSANAGTFATKVDYTTGTGPYNITTGDFNGDGKLDLATANANSSTASVLLGNGDGTFATKVDYTVQTSPHSITTGDFNGDGKLDLATANYSSNSTSILLGNGDGTFATKVDYATGTAPYGITTGDFNGDGKPDLATANANSSTTSILLGNGDGTFATKVDYTVGTSPRSVTIGDFNGDGKPDLATANYSGPSTSILLGNGDGTFATKVDYTVGALDIINADFNGDGKLDLATANNSGTAASILLGNGNGTFASSVNYTTGSHPYGITTGDFNGDGKPDLATANNSGPSTSILFGNGNGTFATKVDYATGLTPYNIATGDFNGDGNLDLATVNNGGNTASILLNNGDSHVSSTEHTYNSSSHSTKITTSAASNSNFYQSTPATTGSNLLTAYVYTDGSAVTTSDAQLTAAGSLLTTTYTATATSGWYKLTATVTGTGASVDYGISVKPSKTVYIDDVSLMYYGTGTLTSAIKDTSNGSAWGALTYTTSGTGTTQLRVRSSNNSDMSGAPAFASCGVVSSGTDLTGASCVNDNERYIQYQVTLIGLNGQTPVLQGISIDYAAYDNTPPVVNASALSMEKANGGSSISSNGWTNGSSPYFSWTAGTDNESGIAGYCAYLGQDNSADPHTTKGLLGTDSSAIDECPFVVSGTSLDLATPGYIGTALSTSNSPYYLSLKAIDVAGNLYGGSSAQFQFRFDNTPPSNPAYLSAPSQYINTKSTTLTWPSSGAEAASDANSGIAGMQYQIGTTGWYGDSHSGSGGSDDLLTDDGSYTTTAPSEPDQSNIAEGLNLVYLRTWDQAGNISTTPISTALKINTSNAPSTPNGVGATPTTNTANSFAFHWSPPSTFSGSSSNLVYCYTVNSLPTANNCTFTAQGVTTLSEDAFATQPDENVFYVVARDEANNINYSNFASVSFYANTPAPGIPVNTDLADVSVKATSNWRLAVTWDAPSDTGVGIANYRILRKTESGSYSQVGTSNGTSYVDSGLTQQKYYYEVKACDSANQCSAASSEVSKTPTGKFTTSPVLTSNPVVSNVTTKKAEITWSTDRNSDSKVTIGTKSGEYSASEVGNSSQTTAHTIDLDNLAAGTTYYFRAKWTDEDGNTGSSQEFVFQTTPAPVLKEVSTAKIGLSTATIHFTTKGSVKAQIYFGKSEAFGGQKALNTSASESTYDLGIDGLDDGAKYLYKIVLSDSEGGQYPSSIFTFATPPRPKISNLQFQPVSGQPTSTQKVTWITNVATNSTVTYGKSNTAGTDVQLPELKTSHEITLKGLEDNSEYFLLAQGRDVNGNLAVSDRQIFKTALDTRPPEVSSIVIEPNIRGTGTEARGQIVVSWSTDEPSTSQVAYAEGSNATTFNNKTAEDAQLTTEHLVIVSDIPTSRVYTILPVSKDKSGNQSQATAQAAIVGRASDSVLNIVLNTLKKVFGL